MNIQRANKTGTTTGTTTASYVEALSIDTRGMGVQGKTLLIINNTDGTSAMLYKIDGYPLPNSTYFVPIKAETSIAKTVQVVQTDVDKQYAKVVVSVKDDDGHATYQIDYTTY